ncbi:PP0621 family protein [Pseudacidovorax intermedius]|uniref:Preprotein translocase subunit YajC n=1 Tax=Pseudacidovorax intermedius TaxID=433924 RepID=A0A147HD53_9BURK|nr:PP0621 family protein [Pseudacidovorax intermedius]KTT27968.1 hypothetical protein NS331_00035 [Pseudacidovorax intermedius]
MKYLLVIAVVAVAIWIWRRNRQDELDEARPRPQPRPAVKGPQPMVRCSHCGMHLPATEAIDGPGGPFCSERHRQAARR